MKTDVYVSSLCNVKIIKGRRRGNTTRIVNNAIELLFNKHTVNVEDHTNNDKLYCKKQVLNLIKERLYRDFTLTEDNLNEVVKDGNILISLGKDKALHIGVVMQRFNLEHTWEYNLLEQVRWSKEDAKEDVFFYVKNWLQKIAEEEGYTLTKKEV